MFVHDLQKAELGDRRATKRLSRIASDLATAPGSALPAVFPKAASLEAAYRLVNRKKTTMEAILKPHAEGTVSRSRGHDRVLIIHDTTEFAFNDHGMEREHLSQLTSKRQGFYDHVSLVLSATGEREVIGVLSHLPYVHVSQIDAPGAKYWAERGGLYENEHERWLDAVRTCEAAFESDDAPERIHVCDREGDSFELLQCLQELNTGYVIRCSQRHRIVLAHDGRRIALQEFMSGTPQGAETRTISIPVEKLSTDEKASRAAKGAPKARRTARVTVRWGEVTLAACAEDIRRSDVLSQPLVHVSVVEVTEIDPPEGLKPASWLLYHSEPVQSEEDAWDVVDIYRARWTIEEYFKVVKTGLAYETRQFMSAHSLLNMLAISAVVACDVLCLREFDRHHPDKPADERFDADVIEYAKLRYPTIFKSGRPTMAELLAAAAREGGHLKRNGPPGWQVLYRGYTALLNGVRVTRDLGIDLAAVAASRSGR